MKPFVGTVLFSLCLAVSYANVSLGQTTDEKPRPGLADSFDRGIANAPEDPANLLKDGEERQTQQESLIPVSPLGSIRDKLDRGKDSLYDATSFRLGFAWTTLFQTISDVRPDADRSGVASDFDIYGTWELTRKGTPTQGQIFFQIEGRWDYGTTAPSTLGLTSLGTLIGTADSFSAYSPTFLPFRNFYWQQGSTEASWIYRVGKITPDQILGTSRHFSPFTTFLPTAAIASNHPVPDTGLGAVGAWYFSDRSYVLGLISDANGDRTDLGNIEEGDFFEALEFGYKINPKAERAGYSKITVSHMDGTSDGMPNNAALGPSGWGIAVKLEQELTADGELVGILKYGHTTNDSGLFKHIATAHLLLYNPWAVLQNDLVGVGYTWAEPGIEDTRDESNLEIFYRFPLLPQWDTTLSYQSVFNPALNPDIDHASVFSLRLRTIF